MTEDDHSTIHGALARYYSGKLAAHGLTARGVDWRDQATQHLRHQQFDRLLGDDRLLTIADLGCGYGDYFTYLRSRGYVGHYAGYDVARDMIVAATNAHGSGADRTWHIGATPLAGADVIVASGIFNVKQATDGPVWERYIETTIGAMATAARAGFGFNMLSIWSDPDKRRSDLYYGDPSRWFEYCARRFGRRVAILQDYGLYEFTLLCRLERA